MRGEGTIERVIPVGTRRAVSSEFCRNTALRCFFIQHGNAVLLHTFSLYDYSIL